MIHLLHKSVSAGTLAKRYPSAAVLDLTSKGPDPWVKFSPFYPHGRVPVPFSPGYESQSVEGIWQGLKVFESEDIDLSKLEIRDMKGLKRTVRRLGRVRGHRQGVEGTEILDYAVARGQIYLPSYRWVLENRLQPELELLRRQAEAGDVVLLDYETNCDIADLSKPLSHAGLVRRYLLGDWPA